MVTDSLSGRKAAGDGVDNTPLPCAEFKERVEELYTCFPSGPSWLTVG